MNKAGDQFETGFSLGDELLAYWRRMPRGGGPAEADAETEGDPRGLPHRDQLNPADIKSLLPNIFLLEWLDRDHAITRLRGTWLDERVERPRDNYDLFEQYSELHRASYKDFVEAVVCRPCGAALRRLRVNEFGRSFCYHTTYFPMVGGSAGQSKGEGKDDADSDGDGERGARMFIVGAGWLEPLDEEPVLEDTPVLYEGAKFVGATWIDIGFGVPDSLFFR